MNVFRVRPGVRLWLASGSPRRKALLESLGLRFQIIMPENAEPSPEPRQSPSAYCLAVAKAKAVWARDRLDQHAAIIAADTVVHARDFVLGKPADKNAALDTLKILNNSWHSVYTAVAVIPGAGANMISFCEETRVHFAHWEDAILKAYAASSEPMDKAGAYAIQGSGAFLSDEIQGSSSNVVGLPLASLAKCLLERALILPEPV